MKKKMSIMSKYSGGPTTLYVSQKFKLLRESKGPMPPYCLPILNVNTVQGVSTLKISKSGPGDTQALFDTGSHKTIISPQLANKLAQKMTPCPKAVLKIANSVQVKPIGIIPIKLELAHKRINAMAYVLENLPLPLMIGRDVISKYGIILDVKDEKFWFKSNPRAKYPTIFTVDAKRNAICKSVTCPKTPKPTEEEIKRRVQALIDKYPTVLRKDKEYGLTSLVQHVIETEGPPVAQKPYRYPPRLRKIINDQVEELLKRGMIRPSTSPNAAPVVLDMKRGKPRLCINYTRLNDSMKTHAGPMENCNPQNNPKRTNLQRHRPQSWILANSNASRQY